MHSLGAANVVGLYSFADQPDKSSAFTSGNLVLLNLWGCHSLKDDAPIALTGMSSTLRTLIFSECHRLTDSFEVIKWSPCYDISSVLICCEERILIHLCSLDCPGSERPAVESFKPSLLQAFNG